MANLIEIDKKYIECTALNTDEFLRLTLGDTLDLSLPEWETLAPGEWLMESDCTIKGLIEQHEDQDYLMNRMENTYNYENDLSDVFQYVIYYPADAGDWIWCDGVYVAVEPHLGGDVRGNYGNTRLYGPIDNIGDSYFFDQVVGWYLEDYETGERVETDEVDIGYHSHPTYHLTENVSNLTWDEAKEGYVGEYKGQKVVAHPCHYI